MNHKVHQITGVVIAQGALIYHDVPALSFHTMGVIFCGYMAAMFPDLDKPGSFYTQHQPFRAFSEGLSRIGVPHRGPTHSLLALIAFYLFFQYVIPLPDVYVWAIVLGFASHIFLDLFNAAGVMLLYPWKFDFKVLPSFMAVSSEDHSLTQTILQAAFTVVFYALLANTLLEILSQAPGVGNWFAYLHKWGMGATKSIWSPIVQAVQASIHGVQVVINYPIKLFGGK